MTRFKAIKPTTRDSTWPQAIFVDTETRNEAGVHMAGRDLDVGQHESIDIHMGVAVLRRYDLGDDSDRAREEIHWAPPNGSTSLFWGWVQCQATARRPHVRILAHEARFDMSILRPDLHLPGHGWRVASTVDDGQGPFILSYKKGGGDCYSFCDRQCPEGDCVAKRMSITILCTKGNYGLPSLEQVGKDLGFPKMQMPDDDAPESDWFEYCARDVHIIEAWFDRYARMVVDNRWGQMAHTVSSQSRRILTRRMADDYMKWPMAHDKEITKELEAAAYFGGRSEDWWHGRYNRSAYLVDVRSMYPSVMAGNMYSTFPLGGSWDAAYGLPFDRLKSELVQGKGVVAEVGISAMEPMYPLRLDDGRVIYPTGRFITTLATPELEQAVFYDEVEVVLRMQSYSRADIFTDFVNHLWGLRKQAEEDGDMALSRMCKLLLNSGYGKFAQRDRAWNIASEPAPDGHESMPNWTSWDVGHRNVRDHKMEDGVHYERAKDAPFSERAIPVIAAEVTSYARMKMWGLLEQAGGRANVLYMDTDSLIVTKDGLDRLAGAGLLPADPTLGDLEIQSAGVQTHIYGNKDYITPSGVPHISGVKRPSESFVKDEDGVRTYQYLQFPSYQQSVRDGGPRMLKVQKEMTGRDMPPGRIDPAHLNIAPVVLRSREYLG